jgi:anti-sigma regulatory factor (Ser/Thr protein kinase)
MHVTGPEVDITVAAEPTAARQARHALADCRLVEPAQQATLLLLVSELVTNSVRHAGMAADEAIRLRASCDHERAHVEVRDSGRSDRTPRRRDRDVNALEPGGLGLKLVDEMADRWGVCREDQGTCVWFDLACAG